MSDEMKSVLTHKLENDEPLTPIERVRLHFLMDGHDEDADAFATVDWLMQNYLLTNDPLTQDATDLQTMLLDVVNAWTPKE